MKTSASLRAGCITLTALIGIAAAMLSASAAENKIYDIAGGDLAQALRLFAQQSDQQTLYAPNVAVGLRTRGFHGYGNAADVLARLLEGTGLTYAIAGSGTLMIMAADKGELTRRASYPDNSWGGRDHELDTQSILEEVIVTATRQTSTANRVPMSIVALTRESLQQSGAKNIDQLSWLIPSVTFRRNGNEGNPTIAIRGISSSIGAPTTAIYLDDTPLQKRDNPGFNTGNGTPFPQLFDLLRVEILRGPQGTLYGSSAQGGAIRFISPPPSLVDYSGFVRSEISHTEGGDPSHEIGIAFGGPLPAAGLFANKVGFRFSAWQRHTGGYLDHVSIYDGHHIADNTNSSKTQAVRLAVAWEPIPQLRITPALYVSHEQVADHDVFWENVPAYTVNAGYFTNRGSVNGVSYNFPDQLFAGGSFGPYAFGPYKSGFAYYQNESGAAEVVRAPRTTRLSVPTLTLDYSLTRMDLKSITSYAKDRQRGYSSPGPSIRSPVVLPTATNNQFVSVASHTAADTGVPVVGGVGQIPLVIPGFPQQWNRLQYDNARHSFTQELRLTATPNAAKLGWVAGLFYANAEYDSYNVGDSNTDAMSVVVRGVPERWFTGTPTLQGGYYTIRSITVNERELAAFGEARYALTNTLNLTAGARLSRTQVTQRQSSAGQTAGVPPEFIGTPAAPAIITDINQANHAFPDQPGDDAFIRFSGTQTDTPVNPRLGLSWQANEHNLFYGTVAKGYRSGGINQPAPPINCATDLQALGLTGIGTPLSYASDSTWNYEAGAKLRLLDNRAQLNASVYYIDWQHPQLPVRLRCAHTYVTNAGAAASSGFDLQMQYHLSRSLSLEGSLAYTDAHYTKTFAIAAADNTENIVVARGDSLSVPKWQAIIAARYDFMIGAQRSAYVRMDYQYAGSYPRGAGSGRVGYDPLIAEGDATHYLAARAEIDFSGWELALFANNLGQSQDRLIEAHVMGYPLVTATTFRPRELGLQVTFRFD